MSDCSFCLKNEKDVPVLISGPRNVFICDECNHLASIIISKAFLERAKNAEDDAAYVEAGRKLEREATNRPGGE